jgi:hypothetical protein
MQKVGPKHNVGYTPRPQKRTLRNDGQKSIADNGLVSKELLMFWKCHVVSYALVNKSTSLLKGACGSIRVVGWGTTSRKIAGSIPDEAVGFFNWSTLSGRTMAVGSTQPLTEMSTRNLPESKGRPARNADNLSAICEPIV